MEKGEMGWTYGSHRDKRKHTGFRWETLKERSHLEDVNVDGANIKMDRKEIGW